MSDHGKFMGPFSRRELEGMEGDPDVLFDITLNKLTIRHTNGQSPKAIEFGPHVGRVELSSALTVLEILAENPGRRMTIATLSRFYDFARLEANTLAKYMRRLRGHIGDEKPYQFLLTDEGVAQGCSATGSAYYANPYKHWRVIKWAEEGIQNSIVAPIAPPFSGGHRINQVCRKEHER